MTDQYDDERETLEEFAIGWIVEHGGEFPDNMAPDALALATSLYLTLAAFARAVIAVERGQGFSARVGLRPPSRDTSADKLLRHLAKKSLGQEPED